MQFFNFDWKNERFNLLNYFFNKASPNGPCGLMSHRRRNIEQPV